MKTHARSCPTHRSNSSWLIPAAECDFCSGYRRGLSDAARAVSEYAEERLTRTRYPNASEDITAALRVAAKRVEGASDDV